MRAELINLYGSSLHEKTINAILQTNGKIKNNPISIYASRSESILAYPLLTIPTKTNEYGKSIAGIKSDFFISHSPSPC